MKMNWYYRTMLSYAPTFFVIMFSFILVYFAMLNSSSKNKYLETNKAILQQMVEYTDSNLKLIERNVSRMIFTDETVQSFFDDSAETVYDYYLIQKGLIEFSSNYPFALSIYLYNERTGEFLTTSNLFTQQNFGDLTFLSNAYMEPGLDGWTSPRNYRQNDQHQSSKVVSLFKYFPYPSDKKGAIILNVDVDSVLNELNRMNSGGGSIILLDGNNLPFQSEELPVEGKSIFAQSAYTGWQYFSESIHNDEFTIISLFSNFWIVFGMVIILIAIAWFTVVTHFNYKPIQNIVGKIGPYMARRSEGIGIKSSRNELKLIEGAIDHLLERTVDYDHLHSERELLKQKSMFHDLLVGYRTATKEEWAKHMAGMGLQHAYDKLGVIVFEIDRYAKFKEQYNSSDQYLLKYIVENAFLELIEQKNLISWHLWVHPHQLAVVLHLQNDDEAGLLNRICEEYREWINMNLELTLSSGIGDEVGSISDIEKSYRSASTNVSFKTVAGTNAIIDHTFANGRTNAKKLNWHQSLQETVHLFKLNDQQWMAKLDETMEGMKQSLVTRREMSDFINHLTHHLQKVINCCSEDIQELWREEHMASVSKALIAAETIDELHHSLIAILVKLDAEIERERFARSNHNVAIQIKAYIDQHYADPNLSLNQVSDIFGVSPKNVSSLFKEELDVKFIDYLLKVRFDHAKQMLMDTDEPIQNIAEKVGYMHVISFHRAFKKMFELPPGEYRNLYRS